MSRMITNADGSQSEVFSKDEMETAQKTATDTATKAATDASTKLVEEKIEEYKKQNPPEAEAIEKLKEEMSGKDTKISELEEAAKGNDGDKNVSDEQIKRLRTEREEMKKDLEGKITEMGKAISAVTGDAKTELITAAIKNASQSDIEAAGGADEFKKKLELKFDSFKGDALTRTEIAERVKESVTLVTGNKPSPNLMDNSTGAGSKGTEDHEGNQPKEVSESTKKVGTGLGITDEDRKKYGPGGEKHHSSSSAN